MPRSVRGSVGLGAAGAVIGVLSSGCVGVPFVLPPTRIEVGSGFRHVDGVAKTAAPAPVNPAVRAGPPESPPTNDNPLVLNAGVYPLGFGRQLLERHVDVGVGYTYQGGPRARIHGAFLEGQGMLGRWSVAEDAVVRVGVRTQLRILGEENTALLGRGATLGVFTELVGFGAGEFGSFNDNGGVVGIRAGEGGIGLAIDAGYAQVDQLTVTSVTGSLTIRIPVVAGFAFKWLWALDKK